MAGFSTNDSLIFERKLDDTRIKKCSDVRKTYELNKCSNWINGNDFKRVCLQFPDGMLCDATSIANFLKNKTSAKMFVLADTSYGSCCADCISAKHVNADALIHFGPACLSPQQGIPILYIYEVGDLDLPKFVKAVAEVTDINKTLIIFYDCKYHHLSSTLRDAFSGIDNISVSSLDNDSYFDSNSKTVSGRTFQATDLGKAQGLYVGPDSMTLTNLVLRLPEMQWFHYNEGELQTYSFQTSRFLMKRLHLVEKLKDAQVIGIVVATLGIENYLTAVKRVKELSKLSGKRCYTLAVGRPNVAKLANFPEIDVFVLVSCPENTLLLENKEFYKPLVSLFEVELAFGGRPWDSSYSLDFRQILPDGDLFVKTEPLDMDNDADVSLVTGKIRNLATTDLSSNTIDAITGTVSVRDPGIVATSRAAEYLSGRTWAGLEQRVGESVVEEVQQGRRGIPSAYDGEGE